ncbi:uncharacterized protein BXZ73DRAFT_105331 [Epithele typhae]|uniref:uncharacterized protein n=1 Tax=Epithele typhae TaxID=378194 RepID=UPI002007BBF6|nr:uncharacterized protein BXZ73DRAFT_105331 [Epithele typhae]KAH9918205.1 hypothetical protein BXZ73DRAFT_105331 [Epithele typhae]
MNVANSTHGLHIPQSDPISDGGKGTLIGTETPPALSFPSSTSDHASPPESDYESDSSEGGELEIQPGVSCDDRPSFEAPRQARRKNLLEKFAPREQLRRSDLYDGTHEPPLWRFGFAFKHEAALQYATDHQLKVSLGQEGPTFEEALAGSGGKPSASLTVLAFHAMKNHLSKKCGFFLQFAQIFSREHGYIISLWTNYDYDERSRFCLDYDFVLDTLEEAFRPYSGAVAEAKWYLDMEDDCLATM